MNNACLKFVIDIRPTIYALILPIDREMVSSGSGPSDPLFETFMCAEYEYSQTVNEKIVRKPGMS